MSERFDNLRGAIDDLERRIGEKREELNALLKEQRELRMSASPVKEGDVVICTRFGRRIEAIVRRVRLNISYKLGEKPWIKVSLRRVDGEWSKQEIRVFGDYEVKDAN